MELKTEKLDTSRYNKGEIGQLSDHIQWVRDNTTAEDILPLFVGPHLSVTDRANPTPEMAVIELSELNTLARRLNSAVTDVSESTLPISIRADISDMFAERDLLFPDVLESIEFMYLASQ